MACGHSNPTNYAFCATCGSSLQRLRCQCGSVAASDDVYCGQCGANLVEARGVVRGSAVSAAVEARYDLDEMLRSTAAESNRTSRAGAHLSQNDIQEMLTRLKGENPT